MQASGCNWNRRSGPSSVWPSSSSHRLRSQRGGKHPRCTAPQCHIQHGCVCRCRLIVALVSVQLSRLLSRRSLSRRQWVPFCCAAVRVGALRGATRSTSEVLARGPTNLVRPKRAPQHGTSREKEGTSNSIGRNRHLAVFSAQCQLARQDGASFFFSYGECSSGSLWLVGSRGATPKPPPRPSACGWFHAAGPTRSRRTRAQARCSSTSGSASRVAMCKTRPIWPASAAQAADWPRLAEARGSLRHDLALKGASGEPAGRGLSRLVFHVGAWPL